MHPYISVRNLKCPSYSIFEYRWANSLCSIVVAITRTIAIVTAIVDQVIQLRGKTITVRITVAIGIAIDTNVVERSRGRYQFGYGKICSIIAIIVVVVGTIDQRRECSG